MGTIKLSLLLLATVLSGCESDSERPTHASSPSPAGLPANTSPATPAKSAAAPRQEAKEEFSCGRQLSPLLLAVTHGDLDALRERLHDGTTDVHGRADAVHHALLAGAKALAVLQLLSEAGSDLNVPDENGNTVLHYFAARPLHGGAASDEQLVQYLLTHGTNLNATNAQGNTPLHLAAWRGNVNLIKLLLAHGARPGVKNKSRQRPYVMQAFQSGGQGGPVESAPELTRLLLRRSVWRTDRDIEGDNAVQLAIAYSNLAAAEAFLRRGVPAHSINQAGGTPLAAATAQRVSAVPLPELFCRATLWATDPNLSTTDSGEIPLLDRAAAVRLLLRHGARVNHLDRVDGKAALHRVLSVPDLKTARILVEAGAKMSLKDRNGRTPLNMLEQLYGRAGAQKALSWLRGNAEPPPTIPCTCPDFDPFCGC